MLTKPPEHGTGKGGLLKAAGPAEARGWTLERRSVEVKRRWSAALVRRRAGIFGSGYDVRAPVRCWRTGRRPRWRRGLSDRLEEGTDWSTAHLLARIDLVERVEAAVASTEGRP